jgi:hypothetical protein
MASRKSKSTIKQGLTGESTFVRDELERDLKVMKKYQINILKKLEPIFTAVRTQPNNGNSNEDVARKYEAFLHGVSQVMKNNNILTLNVGYFVDPHSYNSPNYATLELNSHGLIAEHCDGPKKIENVMDVLYDLHEPELILRMLIHRIAEKTGTNNRRIAQLESSLELVERVIRNSNITSAEPDVCITSNKNSQGVR